MIYGINVVTRHAVSVLFVRPRGAPATCTRSCYRSYRKQRAEAFSFEAADPFTGSSSQQPLEQALYVVGTPIGNLEDISFRALRILRNVNLILAEDTRHTRKLLHFFNIKADTLSCHQHNERQRQDLVLHRLQQGEPIALVSDAGMPAISDPGAQLVAAAVAAGCKVIPIPGPCAAVTALAASGLPTDSFHFVGFLPPKSSKRCSALQQLASVPATLVIYAPPHGLAAILADTVAVLGPTRRAVVARELTKVHEEFYRGLLSDVLAEFAPDGRRNGVVKGELVLLVEGCPDDSASLLMAEAAITTATAAATVSTAAQQDEQRSGFTALTDSARPDADQALKQLVRQELLSGNTVSASSKQLAKQFKITRGKVYKMGLEVEQELKAQ